ncbi:MAG: hypothetical protein IJG55_01125 [Synergistaceae bacterium]|nr:hypothetical protein [Synergistaceae bacterium]
MISGNQEAQEGDQAVQEEATGTAEIITKAGNITAMMLRAVIPAEETGEKSMTTTQRSSMSITSMNITITRFSMNTTITLRLTSTMMTRQRISTLMSL